MSKKYIFAIFVLLAAADRLPSKTAAGEIRIRIYDYVAVTAPTLKSAEKEAARILGGAGIKVVWLDCEILREERPADHPCSALLMATDIHLRIITREMASRVNTNAGCVGYSLVSEGFDSIGAVFHHRAVELKRQLGIPLGAILGAAIAHEVGHLLLEDSRHANSGLMSAHWSDRTLLRIFRNQLGFSKNERWRLESQVVQRIAWDRRADDSGLAVAGGF